MRQTLAAGAAGRYFTDTPAAHKIPLSRCNLFRQYTVIHNIYVEPNNVYTVTLGVCTYSCAPL